MPTRVSPFRPREALLVVLVALLVRLAAAIALDTPGNAERGVWEWGYEAGCIGDSIARGDGFANTWTRDEAPWSAGSGATAWLTPAYPALVALCFELGGGLTRASAWMLIALQSVASALTCLLIAHLGARLAAARAGRIAAWALALHPLAVWHSVATVWDTTFAALAFTAVLTALAACQDGVGSSRVDLQACKLEYSIVSPK